MTERPEPVEVEVLAPSMIDPAGDYERVVHGDTAHDSEAVDALLDGNRIPAASISVPAARHLAVALAGLGRTLADPHSLRTIRDAAVVIEQLRLMLRGASEVATGLTTWMAQAQERGDLSSPRDLTWALQSLAAGLAEDADQMGRLSGYAELDWSGPGMRHGDLVDGVSRHLRKHGVRVTKVSVYRDQTHWHIGERVVLILDTCELDTWALYRQDPEEQWPSALQSWPLFDAFIHPAQIAKLVSDALDEQDDDA